MSAPGEGPVPSSHTLQKQPSSRNANGSRPASREPAREPAFRGEGDGLAAVPACPGRLTEAYDVQKAVGKGGYAIVYKGIRAEDGRVVAVKKVEVWRITSSAVQSQARTRSDVHGAAAELYEQLVLLASEVAARLRGLKPPPPSTPPNGKRSSAAAAAAAASAAAAAAAAAAATGPLAAPPMETLRGLHPLYFSEPLVPPLRSDADAFQKQQLGAFLHLLAWLLRLNSRPDAAAAVEAHLEIVPAAQAPTARLAAASRSGGGGAAAAPPPSHRLPLCTNVLKGAEAAKRGAQVLGLSTEFAPVNAIALGHGRAVVGLLQEAVAASVRRVPLGVRPLGRPAEASAEEDATAAEEVSELEGDADCVVTAASASAGANGYGSDDGDDEAEYGGGGAGPASAAAQRARDSLAPGADKTDGLDGSRQIKLMHDAMRSMRKEMRRLDIRLGVARNELWAKQMTRARQLDAGVVGSEGDEEEGVG
ncbi:hypothetical protein TSOC_012296 [Tetrabaena socialis]|uniref:Protein kinase domain-containing protein n=1 Tax=Tetrabaena socialis TaxID=47790 RepID=A0A2J7ZNE1_9CHLO|nr:hypothetical protein TSOC_012296 [Tetrabaena socialis]|eukprot:PNH01777.1 hypothetical protein TSOC_012296 [Tetrabaena socialis]